MNIDVRFPSTASQMMSRRCRENLGVIGSRKLASVVASLAYSDALRDSSVQLWEKITQLLQLVSPLSWLPFENGVDLKHSI